MSTLEASRAPRWYGRVLAAGLWVLLTLLLVPVQGVATLRGRRAALQAQPVWRAWQALRQISAGRLHWFGVRGRTPEEWQELNSEWRALLEATPVGWLHEPAWIDADADRITAEAAADAYYAARAGWREHLHILRLQLRVRLQV